MQQFEHRHLTIARDYPHFRVRSPNGRFVINLSKNPFSGSLSLGSMAQTPTLATTAIPAKMRLFLWNF